MPVSFGLWYLLKVNGIWGCVCFWQFRTSPHSSASVGLRLLLWLCRASQSRGADPPWDSAVQGSWWGNTENPGVESRAGSAQSGRAGQRSAWQTARVNSGWFMEQFLLKASSCTLGSGAARLVKLQCPDSLNWLPAAVRSLAKLEQPLPPGFAGCHIGAAARRTDSVKMLHAMRTLPWQRWHPMTPALVLRCRRVLPSMYSPPPSGASRSAVLWDHTDLFSYGAEGRRDALTGLLSGLSKAMVPSFSIATLPWSWLGSKAPGFAVCCTEEAAFPPSGGHCSSCVLPGIRGTHTPVRQLWHHSIGKTLWSRFETFQPRERLLLMSICSGLLPLPLP